MKNKFNVFFVSAEIAPFVDNKGLAQTAGALPKALKDVGHDIRMMMPNYREVNERKYILRDVIRLKEMSVEFSNETLKANGKSAFLPDSKVQVYFLDYKPFFDRPGIYRDPKKKKDYPDNAERFAFFSVGCLETLKLLHWQPDIIHCNDWQTALIPFLLKTTYKNDPFFKNTKVLLTIHDFSEQGEFPPQLLDAAGISAGKVYPGSQIQINSQFNFLKAGFLSADSVNVVGENYAKEVKQNVDLAQGLQDVIQKRRRALVGMASGIDANVWNPEADNFLENSYSSTNLGGKNKNKESFLEEAGLDSEVERPLAVVLINSDLLGAIENPEKFFSDLLALEVQIMALGELMTKHQRIVNRLAKKHRGQMVYVPSPDDQYLHRALAAADLLLNLAPVDSISANHVHAMRYGAVPVVDEDLEFAELVNDYGKKATSATGFLISKPNPKKVVKVMNEAVTLYNEKKKWSKLVKTAMKQDHSWQRVAESYTKTYSQLLGRGRR